MVECGDDDASAETDRAIDRSIVGRSHPPTRQASIIEYNIAMIAMSRKICQVVPVNATAHPLMMTHAHAHMHNSLATSDAPLDILSMASI